MPYPYQDIVALDSSTAYVTIVLDFLESDRSKALKRQFQLMFRPNAYCYVENGADGVLDEGTCREIQETLNTRIVKEHSLLNTHYRFNIAFYSEIQDLDANRMESILAFLKGMKRVLAAPGLQIYSYLFASKADQNRQEDMERFDQCADLLLNSTDIDAPRLILVDKLPLSNIDPWLRATVRMLNVLSCYNVFATSLRGMDKIIWNWTMTEFDVQAKDEEIQKRTELEEQLVGSGEFPLGKLERNFNKLLESVLESHRQTLQFSADNIPIPSNVIGCLLFKKKSLQENIPAFEKTVKKTFYENVTEPILGSIASANRGEFCAQLLQDIPLNEWENVADRLQQVHARDNEKAVKSPDEMPEVRISLEPKSKIEDMRTAISRELSGASAAVKKFIPGYLKRILRDSLATYVKQNMDIEKERILDELRRLGMISIVAADAQDYLKRLDELNGQMMSVSFANYYDRNTFVLISDDTYSLWQDSYQQALNLLGCRVYNYHSLEEFEFQTLTLTTWRLDEYRRNREFFFKCQ